MEVITTVDMRPSRARAAFNDITEALRAYPIWTTLGWQDIRQRYRRSTLGPFWITLTMLATVAGMGPLYGTLLRVNLEDFIPYLALGIITWGLIATLITEGCTCFSSSDAIIRSVRLPLSLHVLRGIYRNVIMFLHNLIAFVPVMAYAGIAPTWQWLLAIPGLLLIIIAAFPATLILGIFCTRFRDMQPIVGSVVQLAFFVTPVMWKPDALGERAYFAHYNPLYMYMELVRGPIYGQVPASDVYLGAIAITVLLYALAIPLFARFRFRVAFWI